MGKVTMLQNHGDSLAGMLLGVTTSLGMSTAAASDAAQLPVWAQLLVPVVAGILPVLFKKLLAGGSAGDRTRAAQKRARAAKLPEGSPERRKLEDEADELDAKAVEKEAAGK